MNPCPCGYHGHPERECKCTPVQIARYRSRISGPLLDRIDLHLEAPALPKEDLTGAATGESSAQVRARVTAARDFQRARQGRLNARLSAADSDRYCRPDEAGLNFIERAMERLNMSARAYHRIFARGANHRGLGAGRRHQLRPHRRGDSVQAVYVKKFGGKREIWHNFPT